MPLVAAAAGGAPLAAGALWLLLLAPVGPERLGAAAANDCSCAIRGVVVVVTFASCTSASVSDSNSSV
jgi:hypothetical protein